MAKWRCGYLPHDGGGDKRGWSLRGSILYPVLYEHSKVLAWVGQDNLGVAALGIMSNGMTEAQGEKVIRFAKQLGVKRVNLMFDCEDTGSDGDKDAL